MPILKLYRNGSTSGSPPGLNNHKRAKRSIVGGWSKKSARSQRNWFYSQNISGLTGEGYSFTLTVKDCPETAVQFHTYRTILLKRLNRLGAVRSHWLVEWQRRQVPHLHGCVYFDTSDFDPRLITSNWCDISGSLGSLSRGQDVKPIHDTLGWLGYLAKHGARGVSHYQRQNKNIPEGWKKTGRMWGHTGDWPTEDPMRFEIDQAGYFLWRRVSRSWSKSQARQAEKNRSAQIRYARQMLKCWDKHLSPVRGVSEWLPVDISARLVVWLGGLGYEVKQVFDD